MTLPEETTSPSNSPARVSQNGDDCELMAHQWDINDSSLPLTLEYEAYQDWPDGHCKHVYSEASEEARRHASGWAMRNTNNHNVNILKKSCLGVLVCSRQCRTPGGAAVHMRPAICDKARKKQLGKPCPNASCDGRLELQPCRGHCGYPVTHFWRHLRGLIFFQAKGVHDHACPELRTSTEIRRSSVSPRRCRTPVYGGGRSSRKRSYSSDEDLVPKKLPHLQNLDLLSPLGKDLICSCPPFECICGGNRIPFIGQPTDKQTYSYMHGTPLGGHDYHETSADWLNPCRDFVEPNRYHHDMKYNQIGDNGFQLEHLRRACSDYTDTTVPGFGSPMSKLKIDTELSPCMYSSNGLLPSPLSHCSPGSYLRELAAADGTHCGVYAGDNTFATDSTICLLNSTTTETPGELYLTSELTARCMLDDFEINEPSDILSLDKPIHGAPSTDALKFAVDAADIKAKNNPDDAFDSLLSLPSITSFLEDDLPKNVEHSTPPNDSTTTTTTTTAAAQFAGYPMSENVADDFFTSSQVRPLAALLSPCKLSALPPLASADSPPSLTELKPVGSELVAGPDGLRSQSPLDTPAVKDPFDYYRNNATSCNRTEPLVFRNHINITLNY